MLFNSYIFICIFFPLCLLGYYLLKNRRNGLYAKTWLVAMSLWFYGYFHVNYLLIMICSIGLNYGVYRWLVGPAKKKGFVLGAGIVANLGVLFYFKYFDFFLDSMNQLFGTDFTLLHILLPLGISFFTFQQISFLVDAYRGEVLATSFVDYALFVSFFPQLVAGPIVNAAEMLPQFAGLHKTQVSWLKIRQGLVLFVLGLTKKVIIADTFAKTVDFGYLNMESLGGLEAILVMLFYTIQLYFDFSGYCDMARGLARMLMIEIPVNFDSPYKSRNIIEFWKRWHITLNRFFTKYVYIPLGGNRRGPRRTCINLMLVFLLSGLWHGAGVQFIVWGAMHGILYVITRLILTAKKDGVAGKKWMDILGGAFTFLYVNVAWVFFRADSVKSAVNLLSKMFAGGMRIGRDFAAGFNLDEFWYVIKVFHLDRLPCGYYLLMIIITVLVMLMLFFAHNAAYIAEKMKCKALQLTFVAVLFVWDIISLAQVSSFLYFNF